MRSALLWGWAAFLLLVFPPPAAQDSSAQPSEEAANPLGQAVRRT